MAKYDSESKEWNQKEQLYELSEDGKTLKNCDKEESFTKNKDFDSIDLIETD